MVLREVNEGGDGRTDSLVGERRLLSDVLADRENVSVDGNTVQRRGTEEEGDVREGKITHLNSKMVGTSHNGAAVQGRGVDQTSPGLELDALHMAHGQDTSRRCGVQRSAQTEHQAENGAHIKATRGVGASSVADLHHGIVG